MDSAVEARHVFIADAVHTFHHGRAERLPCAIVTRGNRIERFVDPEARHERRVWSGLTVHDLRGHVLIPGLFDAHNHQPTAARDAGQVRVAHARSLDDLLAALAEAAARQPAGSWITTEHALTISQLGRSDLPGADVLDAATRGYPTAVRFGAHTMALNSLALAESGIAALTGNPRDGVVDRDQVTGRALGPIREYGAIAMVLDQVRKPLPEEAISSMRLTQREYARTGITSVRVPGLRSGDLGVYQSLLRSDGWLGTRVFGGPRLDPTHAHAAKLALIRSWEAVTGFGSEWLKVDAVKIFVDGGFETSLHGPTHLFLDAAKLEELVSCAVGRGWSVACHAVSQEAIELTLDAFEKVSEEFADCPPLVIEHGFFATRQQLEHAARLGVWLSTQPAVAYMDAELIRGSLPSRVVDRSFPLASALAQNVMCALGSDWNATPGSEQRPFDPLLSIRTSVTRVCADGSVLAPDEAISVDMALYLHTRAPAQLVGADDLGGLWEGAVADFVALDGDLLTDLHDGKVVATVLGGQLLPD